MKRRTLIKDQKGFTLVEVFLAILIFLLGFLPLVRLEVASISGNSYAQKLTQATVHAQSKMEELLSMDFATLAAAANTPQTVSDNIGVTYTINWSSTQIVANELMAITVTAAWTDKDGAHGISLSSIKGN